MPRPYLHADPRSQLAPDQARKDILGFIDDYNFGHMPDITGYLRIAGQRHLPLALASLIAESGAPHDSSPEINFADTHTVWQLDAAVTPGEAGRDTTLSLRTRFIGKPIYTLRFLNDNPSFGLAQAIGPRNRRPYLLRPFTTDDQPPAIQKEIANERLPGFLRIAARLCHHLEYVTRLPADKS